MNTRQFGDLVKRSGQYVEAISGGPPPEIPATILAKEPNLFAENEPYIIQPMYLFDTLTLPAEIDPADDFYPPKLQKWEFFRVSRAGTAPAAGGGARSVGICDTNLKEAGKIPLTSVVRVDTIGFEVLPITPNVGLQELASLAFWSEGTLVIKVEDMERVHIPLSHILKQGRPIPVGTAMHDPDDSLLFSMAGIDGNTPLFGLGGVAIDSLRLPEPLWLRPGIHFYGEVNWPLDADWRLDAFLAGGLLKTPHWCPVKIRLTLGGVTWINARIL